MVGAETEARPSSFGGQLPAALRAHTTFDWTFLTLPTTWGAFRTIQNYDSYNIAFHLGLGVYGGVHNVIKVEHGAIDRRDGTDASGAPPSSGSVGAGSGALDRSDPISVNIRRVENQTINGFRVERENPRRENSFICNETNFLALAAVRRSRAASQQLREAYFLHLPYADPSATNGFQTLARGVAGVILALLQGSGR